jgi:hypothetical protein
VITGGLPFSLDGVHPLLRQEANFRLDQEENVKNLNLTALAILTGFTLISSSAWAILAAPAGRRAPSFRPQLLMGVRAVFLNRANPSTTP